MAVVQPSTKTLDAMVNLLSSDSSTWKGVVVTAVITVHLINEAFDPNAVLALPDLPSEADFDGYAALTAVAGNAQVATDPATRDRLVQLVPPVGGWRWEVDGLANIPETIFGWWAQNGVGSVLLACGTFDAPIILAAVGDFVLLPDASIRLLLTGVQ